MKTKIYLALFLAACFYNLQAQISLESHIVVSGDTTVLHIDNYSTGEIQWQEKVSLLDPWEDIPGATNANLAIPSDFISSEKYYRAVLFNGPGGKTYLTDAVIIELRNSLSEILEGDLYAGGHVFLNQDSFLYVIGDSVFLAPWGCHGIEIDGADGAGIGDGIQNTLDIIQHCQEDSIVARVFDSMVYNGFDDWYLPSVEELGNAVNMLIVNNLLPWHGYDAFMSSTEFDSIRLRVVRKEGDFSTLEKNQIKNYGMNIYDHYPSFAIRRHNLSQYFANSYHLTFKSLTETGQFHISFPDSNNSVVQILFYDGVISSNDQFEWDFQGGETLEGDSIGPFLLGFDFGGYRTVKMTQYTQAGDTVHYESEPFRPLLFRKHTIELPRFYFGTFSTTDFDNDGFEDFLLSGRDTTQLYRNLNGESFEPIPSILPNLRYSFADFGDFDNDGFTDLLIAGYDGSDSTYLTKIFQNMSGTEWEEKDVQIPGLVNGFCEWTDYDRDGNIDFLVSGESMDSMAYSGLFKGNGTGAFEEIQTPFENVAYSTGQFGDYNNDNFPDLVISGIRDSVRYAKLYKNENGEFIESSENILAVDNGSATWADYNADGWLDFSVSGSRTDIVMNPYPMQNSNDYNTINAVSFRHYRNLEDGNFHASNNGSLGNQFVKSNQVPADIDNDGLEDFVITGQSAFASAVGGTGGGGGIPGSVSNKSRIVYYKNSSLDSTLSFNDRKANVPDLIHTDNSFTISPSHRIRTVKCFDFDGDGRTDLLRNGSTLDYPTALYTNTIFRSNTPPTAPQNLQFEIISCDSIYLYWEHAFDDKTPDVAIVYDLYIGTAPGTGDVLSMANNDQLQENWFRLNRPLEKGTYYWSVRARDGARIFGMWAAEDSFTIGVPTPTITFDGMLLSSDASTGNQWYNENGIILDATEPTFEPTEDGSYYCIVTDANGCVSDTSNMIEVVLTNQSELNKGSIKVFPNPLSNKLVIESEINNIINVQIFSTIGRAVRITEPSKKIQIDTSHLQSGIYSLTIHTEHKESFIYKLIKI